MVMVPRVQPRPFRVWSERQKPLLQYTATCRSGRATQYLLGSTDLLCGYSSCPSRRGWAALSFLLAVPRSQLLVSPDAWCVTFALEGRPLRAARAVALSTRRAKCSEQLFRLREKGQACFQI